MKEDCLDLRACSLMEPVILKRYFAYDTPPLEKVNTELSDMSHARSPSHLVSK